MTSGYDDLDRDDGSKGYACREWIYACRMIARTQTHFQSRFHVIIYSDAEIMHYLAYLLSFSVFFLFVMLIRWSGRPSTLPQPGSPADDLDRIPGPKRHHLFWAFGSSVLGILVVFGLWATVGGADTEHLVAYVVAAMAMTFVAFAVSSLSLVVGYGKAKSIVGCTLLLGFLGLAIFWLIWNKGAVPH